MQMQKGHEWKLAGMEISPLCMVKHDIQQIFIIVYMNIFYVDYLIHI